MDHEIQNIALMARPNTDDWDDDFKTQLYKNGKIPKDFEMAEADLY